MISAKKMSEAIRVKRKKVEEEGVENMVDTAALPQMNPQDVINLKRQSMREEILDVPPKSSAPNDPADERIEGTSQDVDELAKRMKRVKGVFDKLG